MRNLTQINLSNTWLTGTLPDWLGSMQNLEQLNMGQTWLEGTFPAAIGGLKRLRELNLEATGLTGMLPNNLCHEGAASKLLQLSVRSNSLVGSARVLENCRNLVQLDISFNNFIGQLPASQHWRQLTMYHANNNRFSGTLPRTLCEHASLLRDLDISHNQMSGNVPDRFGLLASLESMNLASNQFTGPITENIFYFPGLRRLDLSSNRFVGTLPTYAMQFTYALLSADFSNNTRFDGHNPSPDGLLRTRENCHTDRHQPVVQRHHKAVRRHRQRQLQRRGQVHHHAVGGCRRDSKPKLPRRPSAAMLPQAGRGVPSQGRQQQHALQAGCKAGA
ncbi:hypothetical protein COO60DRAFT_487944 [Scenedesmus sp. NREL 46B-D3]|nr:hypothetical protein COO60DRAFT_487944 [Scenedesmus sp. NREL 46B-D3]